MNKNLKDASQLLGNLGKKIFESAVHAAVFAFVSKKVSNFMSKDEEKKCKEKVRVCDNEGGKTGSVTQQSNGVRIK